MNRDTIDRRTFTLQSLMAMLAGVTITISGCGDDDPENPTPTDETGEISSNHGHTAVVTSAQLTAGGTVVLNIQGSANHTHNLELSAAQIVQIRNQTRVAKDTSVTNSHMHTVTFNA
jgi:hypothetical protein